MKTKSEYLQDLTLPKGQIPDLKTLKSTYRVLVKKYNLDNGTEKNEEKIKIIHEAYNALVDKKYLPDEEKKPELSIESFNSSFFDFLQTASYNIDLKKNDNKVVIIDNKIVNLDCSQMTKKEIYLMINKRNVLRIKK